MTAQEQCDEWNKRHPVGTKVRLQRDFGVPVDRVVASPACPAYGSAIVVTKTVEGHDGGGWFISRFTPIPIPDPVPTAQQSCDAFNAKVKPGDAVIVAGDCMPFEAKTASWAWVRPSCGTACVCIEGGEVPYCVGNVRPKPKTTELTPFMKDAIEKAVAKIKEDMKDKLLRDFAFMVPATPTPREQCDEFNARVKVGDAVTYLTPYSRYRYEGVTEGGAYVTPDNSVRVDIRSEGGYCSPRIVNVTPKPKPPAEPTLADIAEAIRKIKPGIDVEIRFTRNRVETSIGRHGENKYSWTGFHELQPTFLEALAMFSSSEDNYEPA